MKKKYLLSVITALFVLTACGQKEQPTDGAKVLRIAKDTAVKTLDRF